MRCVIDSAKGVRHGVRDTKTYVGICHSGHILCQSHSLASVGIIIYSLAKVLSDELDRLKIQAVSQSPCSFSCVTFDRMGQGVHTGGSGQSSGHGGHHIRVDNCNIGDVVRVYTYEFTFLLYVCDDVVDRGLSAGSACCGNSDGEYCAMLGRCYALKGADIIILRVVDDNANTLAGVHGRAAADGDHEVSAGCLISINALLHVLNRGIGLDVGIHFKVNAIRCEKIGNLAGYAEFDQIRIRCYKRFLEAFAFDDPGDLVDGAMSVKRHAVKNKTIHCHNYYPPFYKFAVQTESNLLLLL